MNYLAALAEMAVRPTRWGGDEFTFRMNAGNCKRHTLERLNSFVAATARKRLTYSRLINS